MLSVTIVDNLDLGCHNPLQKSTKSLGKRYFLVIPATIQELWIGMRKPVSPTIVYVCLATGCAILGVVITLLVLYTCQYFGIDILHKNLWVLAIPVTLSLLLNVCFIELYLKYKKR